MDARFSKYKLRFDSVNDFGSGTKCYCYYYGGKNRSIILSIGKPSDKDPWSLCISYRFPDSREVTEEFRSGLLEHLGMDTSKPIGHFEIAKPFGLPGRATQYYTQPLSDTWKYKGNPTMATVII